jgi:hypothetical protein
LHEKFIESIDGQVNE